MGYRFDIDYMGYRLAIVSEEHFALQLAFSFLLVIAKLSSFIFFFFSQNRILQNLAALLTIYEQSWQTENLM